MMRDDDNDGQMIFGDFGGLKLPDMSCRRGKTPKKPPKKLVPTGDRTRSRCVKGAHATTCPAAVDTARVDNRDQSTEPFHVFMTFLIVLPTPSLHIEMVTYCNFVHQSYSALYFTVARSAEGSPPRRPHGFSVSAFLAPFSGHQEVAAALKI